MRRSHLVVRCVVVLLVGVLGAFPVWGQQKRPNILWLIAEDFGPHLGCYGEKLVASPNLDKLAADGVRYTRAYTTAPVCSPSRSAFMTGMYATSIGAHNHRSHRGEEWPLPAGVATLTEVMRDAGYFTAIVGQLPPAVGFKGATKTDWNFTPSPKAEFQSTKWADLKEHQPFYAQVNFQETHRTFHAPKVVDPAKVTLPPYYPDHEVARRDWAEYLDSAVELDRKVGLVLKQLEADGLADDTIVVFFGDNGQAHVRGKQFCYEEGLSVPLIIRWPKNFPAPKGFKAGSVDERFVEAIDLHPTMIDLAGGRIPEKTQGRVFLGERSGPAREYAVGARDRCDETVFRLRTVRDARWRYIRNFTPDRPFLQKNNYKEKQYPVWNLLKELDAAGKLGPAQRPLVAPTMPAEELYDMQKDPWELTNLAGSSEPEHQAALNRLRGVLETWIVETKDQGAVLETAETIAEQTSAKPAGGKRKQPQQK